MLLDVGNGSMSIGSLAILFKKGDLIRFAGIDSSNETSIIGFNRRGSINSGFLVVDGPSDPTNTGSFVSNITTGLTGAGGTFSTGRRIEVATRVVRPGLLFWNATTNEWVNTGV